MIDKASIHQPESPDTEAERPADEKNTLEDFQHRETSSITSETPSLKEVEKRILRGAGIDVYELAQNMVSYGNEIPNCPPRIYLKLTDGSEVIYSGRQSLEDVQDRVEEIAFSSFGASMVPDDITTFQHSGGDKSLGVHGRGMTYALSIWTLFHNLDVTVSSHWNNQRYEGKCLALEGNRLGTKKFAFGYDMVPASNDDWDNEFLETKVSVKGQNLQLVVRSLLNLDRVFLPTNAEYYDASLVTPNEEAKQPIEKQVVWEVDGHSVTVECLEDTDPNPSKRKNRIEGSKKKRAIADTIFIGGLEVITHNRFGLQWAIWGGEHIKDLSKRISRSEDSVNADGMYKEAIVQVIRTTESAPLLESILDLNEAYGELAYQPFELSQSLDQYGNREEHYRLNPKTIDLLKELLLKRYGVLPFVAVSTEEAARLKPTLSENEKVIVCSGLGFSQMLKRAGCEEARDKLGLINLETSKNLVVLAPDKDMLAKMLDKVVDKGTIEIVEDEDHNCTITITGNNKIHHLSATSFSQLPVPWTLPSELLYSVAFFDYEKSQVTLRITTLDGTYTHKFSGYDYVNTDVRKRERALEVKTEWNQLAKSPEAKVEIIIKPRTHATEEHVVEMQKLYEALPRMMSSEHDKQLKELSYTELSELLQREKEEKQRKEKAEQRLDVLKLTVLRMLKGELDPGVAVSIIKRAKEADSTNETAPVRETMSLGVERLHGPAEVRFTLSGQGYGVPLGGYYRETTGDTFKRNSFRGEWSSSETHYEPLEGKKSVPEVWTVATHVELNRHQWTSIPIRVDTSDVTFVQQPGLVVEIDNASGLVRAKGVSKEVAFYQRKGPKRSAESVAVNPLHTQAFIKAEDLKSELADPLKENRDSKLSLRDKAILALNIHQKTFIYDDDPNIATQIESRGSTEADFVKNLLEVGRGTCNYSATRACFLLRLSGVPAFVEGGAVSTGKISTDAETHLWVRFWNGKSWERAETTNGSINPNVTLYTSGSVSGNGEVMSVAGLLQADSDPKVWSETIKYEAMITLADVIRAGIAFGKGTAMIPKSIFTLLTNKESREKRLFSLRRNREIVPVITNAIWLMALEKLESAAHRAVEKQLNKLADAPQNKS